MSADQGGCGAFAAALLSGAVSAPVGDLRERLAAKPSLCARPEGRSQRRVGELVHALRRRGVATRAALVEAWRKEPRFLMHEMRDWMRSGHGHALERAWPKIVAGAAAGAADAKNKKAESDPVRRGGGEGRAREKRERSDGATANAAAGEPRARAAKKLKGASSAATRKGKVNKKALDPEPGTMSIWD